MTAAGLIFSNIHDRNIPDMTAERTIASLPFGGRYRLVDFTLSAMVNAGIDKVGIVTHNNYRSLMDHIGSGKDWDLARRSGGVIILPPFVTAFDNPKANKLYTTRLEALAGVLDYINCCDEDVLVLSDCDVVANVDIADVIASHEASGADMTVVTRKMAIDGASSAGGTVATIDCDGNITEFVERTVRMKGEYDVNTNVLVINRSFLISVLQTAVSHGFNDFYQQAIPFVKNTAKIKAYRFDGYYAEIDSLARYLSASMELLDKGVRDEVFNPARPVYTKVRNSAPTIYTKDAKVKNSLIADGCVIEGEVENSIIFRGVRIRKGTVVRNSIMLQDSCTGENVELNCVITDKNVTIRDDRKLCGAESLPYYISKGKMI